MFISDTSLKSLSINNINSNINLNIIFPNTIIPINLKKLVVIKVSEISVIAMDKIKYKTLNNGSIIVILKFI